MYSHMSVQDSDDEGDMSESNNDDENIPESHNYTEPVSARLSPETKARVDQYGDEHTIGTAESVRRLIRNGLDHAGEPDGYTTDQRVVGALIIAFVTGYPSYQAATGDTTGAAIFIGVMVSGWLAMPVISAAYQQAKTELFS
jgi:hypothetical protein